MPCSASRSVFDGHVGLTPCANGVLRSPVFYELRRARRGKPYYECDEGQCAQGSLVQTPSSMQCIPRRFFNQQSERLAGRLLDSACRGMDSSKAASAAAAAVPLFAKDLQNAAAGDRSGGPDGSFSVGASDSHGLGCIWCIQACHILLARGTGRNALRRAGRNPTASALPTVGSTKRVRQIERGPRNGCLCTQPKFRGMRADRGGWRV